jgi:diamine N-acetyltransferase
MRLAEVTPDNFDAVTAIAVRDDQADLVAPVMKSLAEAYVHGAMAWPRAIYDGDDAVGFVMAFHDCPWDEGETPRSGLWRLGIGAERQGRGYGAFAVRAVCDELRARGAERAYVTFHDRPGGPQPFYERLGFRLTGETVEGELVAVLDL